MAQIQTFDHCGFVVDDIPRSHRFYADLLGAKPLWIANLNRERLAEGWPLISFVEMGGHRFELCLAETELEPTTGAIPRIGFSVTEVTMKDLLAQLDERKIPYEGPITYPDQIPIKEAIRVSDPDGNVLEMSIPR